MNISEESTAESSVPTLLIRLTGEARLLVERWGIETGDEREGYLLASLDELIILTAYMVKAGMKGFPIENGSPVQYVNITTPFTNILDNAITQAS
jgi:hypothetical protein